MVKQGHTEHSSELLDITTAILVKQCRKQLMSLASSEWYIPKHKGQKWLKYLCLPELGWECFQAVVTPTKKLVFSVTATSIPRVKTCFWEIIQKQTGSLLLASACILDTYALLLCTANLTVRRKGRGIGKVGKRRRGTWSRSQEMVRWVGDVWWK